MELKDLRKDKVMKIHTMVLEKELKRLHSRIDRHIGLLSDYKPIHDKLHDEAVERNTKGIPHPYDWHENPLRDVEGKMGNSEVTINKALKKIKLIEAELLDRILTGDV